MANIDAVFNFMFTSPKKDGRLLVNILLVLCNTCICTSVHHIVINSIHVYIQWDSLYCGHHWDIPPCPD